MDTKRAMMMVGAMAALFFAAPLGVAQQEPAGKAPQTKATDQKAPAASPKLPFVTINKQGRSIDVESTICLREGPLELIGTVRSAKEHEAIIAVKARPQHIHLGLLMIGLKSGSPGKWIRKEGKFVPVDPTGDRVRLFLVITEGGETVERPINEFVYDPEKKKTLDDNVFIFSGSRIAKTSKGEAAYAADLGGDVITLVSFDDEVLAWPKAASKANNELRWYAHTKVLPKLGTKIILRIRAVEADEKKSPQTEPKTDKKD